MKMSSCFIICTGLLCLGLAQAKADSADKAPDTGKAAVVKKAKAGKIKYEGGDGSTQEKAIIIKGAVNSVDGVPAEYKYLKKKFRGYTKLSQKLVNDEDKYYDIIRIKTAKGEEIDIYFEITEFFNNN